MSSLLLSLHWYFQKTHSSDFYAVESNDWEHTVLSLSAHWFVCTSARYFSVAGNFGSKHGRVWYLISMIVESSLSDVNTGHILSDLDPREWGSLCCNCYYEHSADNHKNDKYKAAFTSLTAVGHVRISDHFHVFHSAFTTLIFTENLMLAMLLRAELSLWNKLQLIYIFNAKNAVEKMLLWSLSLKCLFIRTHCTSQILLNRTEKGL